MKNIIFNKFLVQLKHIVLTKTNEYILCFNFNKEILIRENHK